MRLFAWMVICCMSLVNSVAAQSDSRWLIVPSSSSVDAGWVEPAREQAHAALVERGADVRPVEQAARVFEAEASAPPGKLSEADLERWTSLSAGAVNDLAEGNYQKALEQLNAAQALSRSAIEELNRDPTRARGVFDTCLYVVRAVLETESETRARATARECRRLVPRAEPSPYMHPPAVTKLLNQIDALQAKQSGELRVTSAPSGCSARLNGVLLGETPVAIGDLFPGRYRVQVECDPDKRGRVHEVTVGAGRATRHVDSRFDDAVESRPSLRLGYASRGEEQKHRLSDARRIGEELGADVVVLLSMPTSDTMELERVEVAAASGEPAALARVLVGPNGASETDLASAASVLSDGRCVDFTSSKPVALPCRSDEAIEAPEPNDWPAGRRPRGQFISGLTLIGVGIAGLATGYALLVPLDAAGRDWVAGVDANGSARSSQQRWFDLGTGIVVSASVGAGALIAGMPLALPEREKTPWWGWVAGAGGLGLAAFSIAYGVTADAEPAVSCSTLELSPDEVRTCFQRGKHTSVAVLTGLSAAPLITMPLVYLLRPSKAKLEPSVQVGRAGAYVGLSGRF